MIKRNRLTDNESVLSNILGEYDRNIKALKREYSIDMVISHDECVFKTDDEEIVSEVMRTLEIMTAIVKSRISLRERDVVYISHIQNTYTDDEIIDFYLNRDEILKTPQGKPLYPKTLSQVSYLKDLEKSDIVFAFGPAGVGKTYVAVMDAVRRFKSGQYQKIILSRPIVEAGESLGFLPGEIKEKVDPYLIPLYDALYDLLGKRTVDEYIENGIIEIAPLAYMRGRTLENAYIILDEAQNTTIKQMKLFLTRLGFNAKMVITGDLTQIDLINTKDSGLNYAVRRLEGIKGIKIDTFDRSDVVRNPLVEKIIERFEND